MEQICIDKGVSEFGCACITWGLYFQYFLGAIALGALIILPLKNAVQAPKQLVKSAMGIGALVIVFLISYALSTPEMTAKAATHGVTETSSKMIGAGLTMFYIALVASAIGLIYSEIKKALL